MALQRMSPGHLQASGCSVHDTSGDGPVRIHIGVLPATTGISRFLELHPRWQYNKVSCMSWDGSSVGPAADVLQHPAPELMHIT